jgi:hypothetical protein
MIQMSEELEQLHILTTKAAFPDDVKEDLHVFFSGLSDDEVTGILNLCKEDTNNLSIVAQLIERRKEALIQNDPATWQEVLSFEEQLVEEESQRVESAGKVE